MNIKDLAPSLQKAYNTTSGYGVVKGVDSKNQNLYFVIPPLPPQKVSDNFSIKKLSEAMSALQKLQSFSEMDERDKLINFLFVRREAVLSSRLEGTWSTIDEVLTPVTSDQEYSDATLSVRGYAHSLESLFEEASKKKEKIINLKNILGIHKEMMSKDSRYIGIPGKLRSPGKPGAVVFIGGAGRPEDSIYNPVPAEYVLDSLEKLINWFSDRELSEKGDAGMGLVLPLRMAVGHSHFEAIHPFSDGNGRVGRALWPLQMIASGLMPLYLSGYVEKEKNIYSEALQAAQKKLNYAKIIDFLSHAIISCSYEMQVTKNKLLSLPDVWKERGKFRKNSAAYNALKLLIKMPIFTVDNLRSELGCSTQAATTAVKQLIEGHIIKERTGNRRNRIFAAEEVILILSREHGSDVDLALEKAQLLLGH